MESAKNAINTADIAPPPCKALPITTNMILEAVAAIILPIKKIKSLVQQLDSKDEVNFGSINVLSLSMEIIPVKHANANDIAGLIAKIFASKKPVKKGGKAVSELKIYGYERTNNIIVVAHPKLTEKIKAVIKQLDKKK